MYKEENVKIWEEYLLYIDEKFSDYIPTVYKNTNFNAVIIEPRIHKNFLTSIKPTMFYLNENKSDIKWGLQIFHGNKNEDFVKEMTKSWDNVEYFNTGIDNFTHIEHSEYMESNIFWKNVNGEKALIFQTDSLLLRSGIDEFLKYDYIGAPWRKTKEGKLVGNGGLSLRSVIKMIEICDNHKPTEQIWEDIFFIKHLNGAGVADFEIARRFSMEDVFYYNPLGVHNPIRHIEPELLRSVLFKK